MTLCFSPRHQMPALAVRANHQVSVSCYTIALNDWRQFIRRRFIARCIFKCPTASRAWHFKHHLRAFTPRKVLEITLISCILKSNKFREKVIA